MKVLYLSTVCSIRTLVAISEQIGSTLTSLTIQKFHRLILKGFVKNNTTIEILSTPPSISDNYSIELTDQEDGIRYNYIKNYKISFVRYLYTFFYTFFFIVKWHRKNRHTEHIVICDVLNVSLLLGACLSRLFKCKVVGIVTDMPGMMITDNTNFVNRIIRKINFCFLRKLSGYVFLTQAMNDVINIKSKPYIVVEGLVDIDMAVMTVDTSVRKTRNLLYAGGIDERYGLAMLIDAFRLIEGDDLRLNIYGRVGNMPHEMSYYEKLDSRFHYMGILPNEDIVEAELNATLLINPRPSKEEFTKYSFPSKNMEYMVSGTPVLTMALPGMPKEYYSKLFVCYDETPQGLAQSISSILNLPREQLRAKGLDGKQFVLDQKNNVIQTEKILRLIKDVL